MAWDEERTLLLKTCFKGQLALVIHMVHGLGVKLKMPLEAEQLLITAAVGRGEVEVLRCLKEVEFSMASPYIDIPAHRNTNLVHPCTPQQS
jgi:hypothetical protein